MICDCLQTLLYLINQNMRQKYLCPVLIFLFYPIIFDETINELILDSLQVSNVY